MGSLKSKCTKSDAGLQALQAPATVAHTVMRNCGVAEVEMAFKVLGANGDGQICISELAAVTEQELQLIMNDVDKNQDGFISLAEFKDVYNVVGDDPIREA